MRLAALRFRLLLLSQVGLVLQDRVPAFSSDRAIETIERQLGQPVTQCATIIYQYVA